MRLTLATLVVAITVARPAQAQSLRESVSDSALVDFVANSAFKILAPEIARAAQRGPFPWLITMPAGSVAWDNLRRHLRTVLRARDTVSADTAFMVLELDAPRVQRDTLFGGVKITYRFRCGNTWWNAGHDYQVYVPRSRGNSFQPMVGITVVEDSDPCSR